MLEVYEVTLNYDLVIMYFVELCVLGLINQFISVYGSIRNYHLFLGYRYSGSLQDSVIVFHHVLLMTRMMQLAQNSLYYMWVDSFFLLSSGKTEDMFNGENSEDIYEIIFDLIE